MWTIRRVGLALGVVVLTVTALNASFFAAPPEHQLLLAHRGVHQTYSRVGLGKDTCTADRINPPTHGYLENTLPSIRAAFEHGADIVEIDIHPTVDGQFAVFHDWTLDCRTNGIGVVREQTMASLKELDAGYGYTADRGLTYPFRGKAVGAIPTLREVLAQFPERRFLINFKGSNSDEADGVVSVLREMRRDNLNTIAVYGGDGQTERALKLADGLRGFTKSSAKSCFREYVALGWTGYVPESCRHTFFVVPSNYTGFLWGWPNRFIERMASVDTEVFVAGPLDGNSYGAGGIDDSEDLDSLGPDYRGGIWTNRIEVIGPFARAR